MDQVLLRGAIQVQQRDRDSRVLPEGEHELQELEWLYHDGVGYWFPSGPTLTVKNQEERGSWADITDQKNISTEEIEKKVLTAYFNHGIQPQKSGYAYVVAPRINAEELAFHSQSGLTILANDQRLQAVYHPGLEQTQAVFYKAGSLSPSIGGTVTVAQPGIVLLMGRENAYSSVSVADPLRSATVFVIHLPGRYETVSEGVEAEWNRATNNTRLDIELPQGVYSGKSVTLALHRRDH